MDTQTTRNTQTLNSSPTLLSLPVELLERIFDIAYRWPKPSFPVCRALLPFYRRRLFSAIEATEWAGLKALTKVVKRNPIIGRYVRSLTVMIRRVKAGRDTVEAVDPGTPSDNQLVELFTLLSSLRDLYVAGSTRVSIVLLSDAIKRPNFLSNLQYLAFNTDWEGRDDPLHPHHYANLPHYTNLKELWLPQGSARSPPSALPTDPAPTWVVPHISRLSIPLGHARADSLLALLPTFTGLTSLLLEGLSRRVLLPSILQAIPRPDNLQTLEINGNVHPSEAWNLAPLLDRFTALETLDLSEGSDASDPSFYRALSALPLKHLTLQIDCTVSSKDLLAFAGSSPSLKRLTLDNVPCRRGPTIDEVGPGVRDDPYGLSDSPYILPDGWFKPDFPDGFTRDDLEALLETTDERGIKFDGMTAQALEIEEAYNDELEVLEDYAYDLRNYVDEEYENTEPEEYTDEDENLDEEW
ncbi:hypothetical protein JCM10207_008442 [Rhodosporidiobolus poonsookiae]